MDISGQAWLRESATQKVMAALSKQGKPARFVGGCVRDALLGRKIQDIDIATQHPPSSVMGLLEAAGIKAIPTGIDHGTVTAVCETKTFEITTLRSDIKTDGRHAEVVFCEDWLEDAHRRDFTFNAMTADLQGVVYDPFDGFTDLKAGRVRFVGQAEERIKEDYLRLLRFFRFNAHFGKGLPDRASLQACSALRAGIDGLSGERIAQEFLRLLEAPHPAKWISLMKKSGVLAHILAQSQDSHILEMLCAFEDRPDALRRLCVLLPSDPTIVKGCADRLRLSNAQRKRLQMARCCEKTLIPQAAQNEIRSFLFHYGAGTARDQVLIYWAEKGFTGIGPQEQNLLVEIDEWEKSPVLFPLLGRDLMAQGIEAGPQLGMLLHKVQDWWCKAGCYGDKAACLAYLSTVPHRSNG